LLGSQPGPDKKRVALTGDARDQVLELGIPENVRTCPDRRAPAASPDDDKRQAGGVVRGNVRYLRPRDEPLGTPFRAAAEAVCVDGDSQRPDDGSKKGDERTEDEACREDATKDERERPALGKVDDRCKDTVSAQ
jgi:hypothetical protein